MSKLTQAELPKLLISLWLQFTPKRRSQFAVLGTLMVASAYAEVVSFGLVLPFLGVLIAPDLLLNKAPLSSLVIALDLYSPEELLFLLVGLFIFCRSYCSSIPRTFIVMWHSTGSC